MKIVSKTYIETEMERVCDKMRDQSDPQRYYNQYRHYLYLQKWHRKGKPNARESQPVEAEEIAWTH